MAIYTNLYLLIFLPLTLLLYGLAPQRYRPYILLAASLFMYFTLSGWLVVLLVLTSAFTWGIGRWLGRLQDERDVRLKELKAQKAQGSLTADEERNARTACKKAAHDRCLRVLLLGLLVLLGILFYVQYYNFTAGNLNRLLGRVGVKLPMARVLFPMGISFYTLEAVGYLADVYWERIRPERHLAKMMLFLSFFPQIMEGPIARYQDTADRLFQGAPLTREDLNEGFLRILIGLFKKMVISDRLSYLVNPMFAHYDKYHGVMIALMAVSYTVQLYCEFSGSIDIVIGSGRLFGVILPENFRQPFSAQSAAEFWRRWHMSLGTWFKNYVFYPVTTSSFVKNMNKRLRKRGGRHSKYISNIAMSAAALLPVWIATGVWHGAGWQYLFYGLYYFVILLLGVVLEPWKEWRNEKLHIPKDARWLKVLRILKTWLIIFTGELFFNAGSLRAGFRMFFSLFRDFRISDLWLHFPHEISLGERVMIVAGCIVVWIAGFLKENGIDLREKTLQSVLPVRWAVYYVIIFAILLFGAYGTGYQAVDLIYANF